MSLLERVTTLVRANLNELLDRAEDPEKMIKQYILDMQNQLIQVKTQVAAAIADEQKLYQRYLQNQEQAEEWQKKAELAVSKGEDELAKQALQRRNSYQSTADGFKVQYEDQKQQVEVLKNALQKLEAKLDEAERKKDLLIARSRRAEAERKIHETIAGIGEAGAMEGFERMEEKVLEKEARAKAAVELGTDSLEEKFAALEKEADLDSQLAELKAKLKKPEEGGA
ncbi:MAG: PspA/IM30 family protein [Sphingomonadaceae bacterium]